MIYIDPTEARENSRLPKNVIDSSIILDNFEAVTGADILVTLSENKLSIPDVNNCINMCEYLNKMGGMTAGTLQIKKEMGIGLIESKQHVSFWKACQEGALIQRKSGHDVLGSIEKMDEIIHRMRRVQMNDSWLLLVGDYKRTRDRNVKVDGRNTSWSWNSFESAKLAWQARGGKYECLQYDNLVLNWLKNLEKGLKKWREEPLKRVIHRIPNQYVVEDHTGINILLGITGIGEKKAFKLLELTGSPARALELLSNPNARKELPDIMKKVGIGEKTLEKVRMEIMGMDDIGNRLEVVFDHYKEQLTEK